MLFTLAIFLSCLSNTTGSEGGRQINTDTIRNVNFNGYCRNPSRYGKKTNLMLDWVGHLGVESNVSIIIVSMRIRLNLKYNYKRIVLTPQKFSYRRYVAYYHVILYIGLVYII